MYVKTYDKEMNSDTDSPAHRVMRKRRGRKKEKRPQTSRTSQVVIEDDAEEELEFPAALPSVQSLPVPTSRVELYIEKRVVDDLLWDDKRTTSRPHTAITP